MYQTQSKMRCPPREHSSNPRPVCKPCYRCLGKQALQTCKFKEAECHKCKKVEHITKACQTKQTFQRPQQKQPGRRANYIEEADFKSDKKIPARVDHDMSYNLFTAVGSGQNQITMDVAVNQTPIQMELDTGADQQANL